jgi:hypothetical protein
MEKKLRPKLYFSFDLHMEYLVVNESGAAGTSLTNPRACFDEKFAKSHGKYRTQGITNTFLL